jgi:hypothetical protein
MALLHIFAVVSPPGWTKRVADELRLRLSSQITTDVQLVANGINILVPINSPQASHDALRVVRDAVSTVELEFADLPLQERLTRLRITL